ncbi:MAG: AbrB/MazE/SpoVT family DNA-binding domain-containing protein [Thermoprotei archaeon]|nr:MAG: AbrB family transcriptional regulator [Desulfurococcales archaeon ex4484_217_2]RLG70775.1 MAG: AbrB/MazE/SpoVT family DNA-binding domain-containing protein [Thermoprotei archaeon]
MVLSAKVRVGKKNILYVPKGIAEAVGLREGRIVKLTVEKGRIIIEVIPDPFELALEYPKFAKTSFEEIEKESEELQYEILKD